MQEKNAIMKELGVYRKNIDKIDDKIIKLLNERGRLVEKVGDLKRRCNLDIYQPERENEIIERLKQKSTIIKIKNIKAIWREIFDACKFIQKRQESD